MKNSAHETIKPMYSLLPQSLAAGTNNGTGIDCKGFDEALVEIQAGLAAATASHVFKVQESSDDAVADAYADVTDASFTAITTANDNAIYVGRINLRGRERYLRVVNTASNDALVASASIILMNAKELPVSQANTVAFNV